jgi:hypothetical protein
MGEHRENIRDEVKRGKKKKKRKEFHTRRLMGRLKEIHPVVCLVCSNLEIPLGFVIRAYRRRGLIELFHRAVKSH